MNRTSAAALVAIVLWTFAIVAPRTLAGGSPARHDGDGVALDDPSLSSMLTGLGYEPKPLSKGFLIAVKKDDWTYYVQFVLSEDKSRLGMNANLGSIPDPDSVTAAQWRGLLSENAEVDPSSFNYSHEQQKLYLHRVLDNRGLTPVYVRQQIENFTANIHDSKDFWSFVK